MNTQFGYTTAVRRKVFVSFHHADQTYRDTWDRLFGHLFISKSVGEGEIDDRNSAEYISRVIRQDYINDATVCVVLIGPNTHCRKHVDWEIAAALNPRVGGTRAGLMGLYLPNYVHGPIPPRLHDNWETGYAKLFNWTSDPGAIRSYVEDAFNGRQTRVAQARNGRLQFDRNHC